MENTNEMKIIFDSRPENEGLARVAAAAFCTQLNPNSGGSGRSENCCVRGCDKLYYSCL